MCDTRDMPSARYVPDGTRKGILSHRVALGQHIASSDISHL